MKMKVQNLKTFVPITKLQINYLLKKVKKIMIITTTN